MKSIFQYDSNKVSHYPLHLDMTRPQVNPPTPSPHVSAKTWHLSRKALVTTILWFINTEFQKNWQSECRMWLWYAKTVVFYPTHFSIWPKSPLKIFRPHVISTVSIVKMDALYNGVRIFFWSLSPGGVLRVFLVFWGVFRPPFSVEGSKCKTDPIFWIYISIPF